MNTVNHEYDKNRFFFNICLVMSLFTTLYSWLINGIPIFNENRFEINTDNSKWNLGTPWTLFWCLSIVLYTLHLLFVFSWQKKNILQF